MQVTLLPNLPAFKSFSMERYRLSLGNSLREILDDKEELDEFSFSPNIFLSSRLPLKNVLRFDRWITYPLATRLAGNRNFHILDQSHAHLALASKKSRFVVTCHDLMFLRDHLGLMPVKGTTFNRNVITPIINGLKRADAIISDSRATQKDLEEFLNIPGDRIAVIYMGKNDCFKQAANQEVVESEQIAVRNSLNIAADAKILFHVGTGSAAKNTSAIIRCLGVLKERMDVVLVRAGVDLSNEEKELLTSLELVECFRFAGQLPDEDLARLYRVADIFVFPSFWEGFGWPALEAMSCGTPVVCSNIPSLKEVVSDAGILVDAADYQSLARNVEEVLTRAELTATLVDKGLERAKAFTWRNNASQVMEVYRSVF